MREAVIVSVARTPIGRAYRGGFNDMQGQALAAHAIGAAVERAGVEAGEIDDVVMGCALQQGSTGFNVARQAALRAGFPMSVPGMTVISDATARRIPDSAYADWELDVDRLNGGQFQFEVDNAINTGNFDSELQDEGLFAPRYIVAGRGSASSPGTSPWRVRIMDVAS